jgi:hypothetical protein
MRRHGVQAQSGAQANPMGGHLIHAVLHHGKALHQRVSAGVHLVGQLLHQHFSWLSSGSRAVKCEIKVISIKSRIG